MPRTQEENKIYMKAYYARNKERMKANMRANYQEKSDDYKARAKKQVSENYDRVLANHRRWRAENPEAASAINKRNYDKRKIKPEFKKIKLFYNRNRETQIIKATPKWADMEALKRFYMNKPENMQVDHIIPLKGKNVCGLHVIGNLQYLTPEENARKGNRV